MRTLTWPVISGLLALVGCGPMPVDVAMQNCIEPAQLAQRPRGSVEFMADNRGNVGTSLSLGISTDYLAGRDPDQVFQRCVQNRSGQPPLVPFHSLPESRL